jgi:hypothetical protein
MNFEVREFRSKSPEYLRISIDIELKDVASVSVEDRYKFDSRSNQPRPSSIECYRGSFASQVCHHETVIGPPSRVEPVFDDQLTILRVSIPIWSPSKGGGFESEGFEIKLPGEEGASWLVALGGRLQLIISFGFEFFSFRLDGVPEKPQARDKHEK